MADQDGYFVLQARLSWGPSCTSWDSKLYSPYEDYIRRNLEKVQVATVFSGCMQWRIIQETADAEDPRIVEVLT
jgi:hypothetical protein